MKKRIGILSLILCIVCAALCLISCSDYGAPEHNTKNPSYAIAPSALDAELVRFMTDNVDRTTFNDGEKTAATYLVNRLIEMGYEEEALDIQDFTTTENEVTGLKSQNVIARIGSTSASAKNVIIGAYYDNRYTAAYNGAPHDGGEGVAAGGTSVATLLRVADYLFNHKSDIGSGLCVKIVFFGASYASNAGVNEFLDKMNDAEYRNTVLMIELQRLCGDHIYAFSDARETRREKFFDKIAADNGLDIYKPTSQSPLITGLSALNGVPYYQWAHSGLFSSFFNAGIPTLNLVGANWDSSNLSDKESADNANISYSENDTLRNLKRYYPDYAEKMATAATMVVRSVTDGEFAEVMQYDRDNFPDTDVISCGWIWYLVVLCVILAAVGVMTAISAHLKKKYPIVPQTPPQMKMAVFGMDYEDKNSADIFIDIQNGMGDGEIFPGVQNNDPKFNNPFDDIFPPPSGGGGDPGARDGGSAGDEQASGGDNNDPFDNA